jgi:hypothetical protein
MTAKIVPRSKPSAGTVSDEFGILSMELMPVRPAIALNIKACSPFGLLT